MPFSICCVSQSNHDTPTTKPKNKLSISGAFEDDDVTHVEGEVNPVRDCEIISEELRLKDQEKLEKEIVLVERACIRNNDKKLKPEYDTLVKIKGVLVEEKKHIRFADWSVHDVSTRTLITASQPKLNRLLLRPSHSHRSTC